MEVLNEYVEGKVKVTKYTKDGVTVSHTVKTPILQELEEEPQPTIEEEILFETKYQTMLLEMTTLL